MISQTQHDRAMKILFATLKGLAASFVWFPLTMEFGPRFDDLSYMSQVLVAFPTIISFLYSVVQLYKCFYFGTRMSWTSLRKDWVKLPSDNVFHSPKTRISKLGKKIARWGLALGVLGFSILFLEMFVEIYNNPTIETLNIEGYVSHPLIMTCLVFAHILLPMGFLFREKIIEEPNPNIEKSSSKKKPTVTKNSEDEAKKMFVKVDNLIDKIKTLHSSFPNETTVLSNELSKEVKEILSESSGDVETAKRLIGNMCRRYNNKLKKLSVVS